MKRHIHKLVFRFAMLLVLGAVVNVAVAWACCLWWIPGAILRSPQSTHRLAQDVWPVSVPSDWPNPSFVEQKRTVGGRMLLAWNCESIDPNSKQVQSFDPPYWKIVALQTGLPLKSMCGHIEKEVLKAATASKAPPRESIRYIGLHRLPARTGSIGRRVSYLLTTRPIWPGFLLNTLFYAGVLWAVLGGPRVLRRHMRRRRGLCPACAYPVGVSPVCTECGKQVKAMGVP